MPFPTLKRRTSAPPNASTAAKSGMPALADPRNVDSEIGPADLRTPPAAPAESEADIVGLVLERYAASSKARLEHEREWLLSTAFARGNQWVEWRDAGSRLESLVDPNDPYRSYITANLIRPILTKMKARATMSKPDASVRPLSAAPGDVGAATEARDVLDHYDALFDRQEQTQAWIDAALDTTTTFLKIFWDPDRPAFTAWPDAQTGELTVAHAPIGDIEEIIVPAIEMFPDPSASAWEECGWLIHAKVRPLADIQARYGERGYRVRGEAGGGGTTGSNAVQRLAAITGDQARGWGPAGRTATVYEMWERPSARYPKGRRVAVAGGALLIDPDQLDWPYDKKDDFPFVRLGYQAKYGTLWALNAVHDLIPLQRQYNNVLSRLNDRVNTDKPTILVPEGSEIGVDAYQSRRNFQKITYKNGMRPDYQAPPPVSAAWFSTLEALKGLMEDLSGVHEVSNGTVPPGVTAGNAIELLQQSDTTQMAEFVGNIETAAKRRAEWEIALVAQFCREQRLIGISQADDPAQAVQAARSFEHLTGGGNVRVTVVPGSATPKTPAARIQQWMDFAHSGMLAPPNLPVFKALADVMGLERADTVTQRIEGAIREIQAQQPNPAQVQQQQAQAQQAQQAAQAQAQAQQQQADQAHAAEMASLQAHTQIVVDAAKTQNALRLQQAKDAAAQGLQQMQDGSAQQLQTLKDLNALELQQHDKESTDFKISGTMDSTAVLSAENAAGLQGKLPPDPVPPAAPGGSEQ